MTEDEAVKVIAESTTEALRILDRTNEARKFISDGLGSRQASTYSGRLLDDLYSMIHRAEIALHNLDDTVKFVLKQNNP